MRIASILSYLILEQSGGKNKIDKNKDNDLKNYSQLIIAGYKVIIIWECEVKTSYFIHNN